MVTHYRRLPALVILVAGVALGALYLKTWGRQTAEPEARRKLEALISGQIPGHVATAKDWLAYGDILAREKEYGPAAEAYAKVLEKENYNRDARQGRAVCLAQAGNEEECFNFMKTLVFSEPKLAVDLFERRELQRYTSIDRFAALYKDAKAQAMD